MYDLPKEYCKYGCVCSDRYIKIFGNRDANRLRKKVFKMSKPEPLRGKIRNGYISNDEMFWKEDVKSAVEFYKKYKDNPEYFTKHFPDNTWWEQNGNIYKENNNTMFPARDWDKEHRKLEHIISKFNEWLFNYCFGDVIQYIYENLELSDKEE